jgi:hypothetical protein
LRLSLLTQARAMPAMDQYTARVDQVGAEQQHGRSVGRHHAGVAVQDQRRKGLVRGQQPIDG